MVFSIADVLYNIYHSHNSNVLTIIAGYIVDTTDDDDDFVLYTTLNEEDNEEEEEEEDTLK